MNYNKLLLLFFCLLCFREKAYAGSWSDSGNFNISWYTKTKSEFYISTAQELAGVAYLVNNGYTKFQNQSIILIDDIDLSGNSWSVIGCDEYNYFAGDFDGNNHTIKGVNISSESGKHDYGFWGYCVGASIRNLDLFGKLSVGKKSQEGTVGRVGGLVGYCKQSVISSCNCYMDVIATQSSTTSTSYNIYVGGLIGHAYYNVDISYCKHEGDVKLQFGSSSGDEEWYTGNNKTYLGGLIGGSYNSKVKYCENSSSILKVLAYGSRNSSSYSMTIGGCIGYTSDGIIESCTSRGKLSGYLKGSKIINISLGGICGNATGKIVNCYTPETDFFASSSGDNAILYYGGITSSSSSAYFKNNYSPSNLSIDTDLTKIYRYSGSTSYSSSRMRTDDFLDELNMYPFIEYGITVWGRDNDYPYIINPDNLNSIDSVFQDSYSNTGNIYSIYGQRLRTPQKGIVIINGKKVLIK